MAKKSTNTEETKQSTVVLNDEVKVNPIKDTTIQNVVKDTPTPTDTFDCSNPDHKCTCKPGHCPNKDCKSGHYWTEGTEKDQYLYHYDSDDETIKLEDADHRKANPNYGVPEPPKDPEPSKPGEIKPNPEPSNPGDGTEDPDQIPSNDCGPELEEPWAHDELLQNADGHTGLERELRLHCGVTYDVVKMWLAEIATATDKDAVIDKIAWHIPTGGPKSIKVHHKAKIVEALKALK